MENVTDDISVSDIPELNGFPSNASYTSFSEGNGKELLDHIFKSETRILIALLPISQSLLYLLEYLYDQGYRRGDFVLICSLQVDSLNHLEETDLNRYKKWLEFADKSLNFL